MLSLEALIERLRSLFKEEALRVDAANSGIATETTLSSINSKIIKADTDNVTIVSEPAYDPTNDLKKVSIENDAVGLARDSTLNSILGQLETGISEILDNVKGAWRLGVKDLDLATTDPEITVQSGVEADFKNMSLANKFFNYGVVRCHGNLLLKAGGRVRLCANSVFRFVR